MPLNERVRNPFGLMGPFVAGWVLLAVLLGAPVTEAAGPPSSQPRILPQKVIAADGAQLEGHLALPSQPRRRVAAVLLIAGSGVTNRYENVPASATLDGQPTLLLQPIEEALLKQGLAVFVYDKRGVKAVDQTFLRNSIDNERLAQADARTLASDALAAFDHLTRLPQIDASRVAVLGHSEGAILALKIAENRPNTKAIGYLGGFHRPFREVSEFQSREMARRLFLTLDRNSDKMLGVDELKAVLSSSSGIRLTGLSGVPVSAKTGVSLTQWQNAFVADNDRFWHEAEELSHPWSYRLPRQWYQQYAAEGSYLQREMKHCQKTLVFHGEKDAQTPFEDAVSFKQSCARARKPLAAFHAFAGLGHGLTRARPSDGMDALGPMSPHAAEIIALNFSKTLAAR